MSGSITRVENAEVVKVSEGDPMRKVLAEIASGITLGFDSAADLLDFAKRHPQFFNFQATSNGKGEKATEFLTVTQIPRLKAIELYYKMYGSKPVGTKRPRVIRVKG